MSCIFTSMSFSPIALSRPNSKTHPKIPKKNLSHTPKPTTNLRHRRRHNPPRDPAPQPHRMTSHGTTYTRLPPKDDFFDESLHDPDEVELSESSVVKVKVGNGGGSSGLNGSEDFEGDPYDVLGLGYKRLDVFEGSLKAGDVEDEEDEYEEGKTVTYYVNEDFDDDQDDVLGSNYRRLDVFEGSIKFDDDNEEEEEDESDDVEGRTVTYYAGEDFDDDEDEEESDDVEGRTVTYYAGKDFDDDEEEEGKFGAEDDKNVEFDGAEDDDDERFKEKGVPAVMRCFDRAKIYVKAGDGGNGVVAFRREKYVPLGGPSGGDGGRGGNVYVEVDGSMNSLLPFRKAVHFRAERGAHGQGRKQAGAKGEDVVVKVAPGTCIREAGKDDVLLELLYPGQRALLLPGGRGGRGNASFKSGTNKVPRIAENGEMGTEMWLELELKLVADVGIVGAPNAGKSTLLSVISAAQPSIANYPFTTLLPNLGVVSFDYDSTIVVADLPGLLEGAHRGFGLGHEFLRHTERCLALIHVVDGSSPQPELEFNAVRLELEMFSPELAEKPFIVAYNKMDLPEAYENWPSFKDKLRSHGIEPFCMSALRRDSTHEVISAAYELLQKNKEANKEFKGWVEQDNLNHVAETVEKRRKAPINDFNISYDKSSNTFHVVGSGLQRFVQMTNWRYIDSDKRFQYVLEACGVNKALTKLGVKEGDTVIVGEMEMVWHDSTTKSVSSNAASAKSNY